MANRAFPWTRRGRMVGAERMAGSMDTTHWITEIVDGSLGLSIFGNCLVQGALWFITVARQSGRRTRGMYTVHGKTEYISRHPTLDPAARSWVDSRVSVVVCQRSPARRSMNVRAYWRRAQHTLCLAAVSRFLVPPRSWSACCDRT